MRLLEVLSRKRFAALAIIAALAMLAIYIYFNVLGLLNTLDVWLENLPWYSALLLAVFCILFGITFAYQVHIWTSPGICSTRTRIKGTATHSLGSLAALLVAQCPSCATVSFFFLPTSALVLIGEYGWLINLVAIGLLVFTLQYLGAFTTEKSP